MLRKISIFVILLSVLLLPMTAATGNAAWDSDKLDQPIAVGGKINKDDGTFSFILNYPNGIPDEPVYVKAMLSPDINPQTGYREDPVTGEPVGTQLFDPERLAFDSRSYLSYIGAELTELKAGTTTYIDNNLENSSEGSNIDMIEHATARLTLNYNPSYTHQRGALWYCIDDPYFDQFEAYGGAEQCSVYGEMPTFSSRSSAAAVTLRAVSIYDPWFSDMEQKYDSKYGPEDYRVDNWKIRYLAMNDFQHRNGGKSEALDENNVGTGTVSPDDLPTDMDRAIWGYPAEDAVSLYFDYQVTIREPIEDVMFRAESQTQTNKGSTTGMPAYAFLNDPVRHPDVRSTNEIWCYDTSDASAGVNTVDAFYISAETSPDYGYELHFELIQGASIGSLNFDGIDDQDNAFRFVPNSGRTDASGKEVTNYGDVIIEVSAPEVNYTKYFVLHYQPSNIRLVRYIGDDWANNKWNAGIVLNEDGTVNDDLSGYWDIFKDASNPSVDPTMYGLQVLLLYPGEKFPLSIVSYNTDGSIENIKKPYYMTSGVPSSDSSKPNEGGDGSTVETTYYAITYAIYESAEAELEETVPDIVEFDRYGEVSSKVENGVQYTELVETEENTGMTYWYMGHDDDCQWITAGDQQGIYYLSYTVAPIVDGEPSLDVGTISGGVYLIICDPVDQILSRMVHDQAGGTNPIASRLPYMVSAGQRLPGETADGKWLPSHWYLGPYKGAVEEPAVIEGIADDSKKMYRGYGYVSFTGARPNLMALRLGNQRAADISEVLYGNEEKYFLISRETLPENYSDDTHKPLFSPTLSDITVAGDFGLNRFPGIGYLEIEDSDGELTAANTEMLSNGKKVFDFSTLNVIYYRHTGMSDAGNVLDVFMPPHGIINLDLGADMDTDEFPNYLKADFDWSADSYESLVYLDISNNSYGNLTLQGFEHLAAVDISGDAGDSKVSASNRYFNILDCDAFELLEGDSTLFNYVVAEFKRLASDDFMMSDNDDAVDYERGVKTALHINASNDLKAVNLSGSIGYAELMSNPNLTSIITSNTLTENNYTEYSPSSYTGGNWVKVMNIGTADLLGTASIDLGFEPSKGYDDTIYFTNGLPFDIGEYTSGYNQSAYGGSDNIITLKLDNIGRFVSSPNSSKSKASTILVNNLYGIKGSSGTSKYDFDFRNAGKTDTSIRFNSGASNARVNMNGCKAIGFYADLFRGKFYMQDAPNLQSVDMNSSFGTSAPSGSLLDISGSGIENLTDDAEGYTGLSLSTTTELKMFTGEKRILTAVATPSEYDEGMSYTAEVINGGSNPCVTIKRTDSGYEIEAIRATTSNPAQILVTASGKFGIDTETVNIHIENPPEITAYLKNPDKILYVPLTDDGLEFRVTVIQETDGVESGDITDDMFGIPEDVQEEPGTPESNMIINWEFEDKSVIEYEKLTPTADTILIKGVKPGMATRFKAVWHSGENMWGDLEMEGLLVVNKLQINPSKSQATLNGSDSYGVIGHHTVVEEERQWDEEKGEYVTVEVEREVDDYGYTWGTTSDSIEIRLQDEKGGDVRQELLDKWSRSWAYKLENLDGCSYHESKSGYTINLSHSCGPGGTSETSRPSISHRIRLSEVTVEDWIWNGSTKYNGGTLPNYNQLWNELQQELKEKEEAAKQEKAMRASMPIMSAQAIVNPADLRPVVKAVMRASGLDTYSIEACVETFKCNNCNNLLAIDILPNTGNVGIVNFEANECSRLRVITTHSTSKMQTLSAYSCSINQAILNSMNIRKVDLHDNKLGYNKNPGIGEDQSGTIMIKDFSIPTWKDYGTESWDWVATREYDERFNYPSGFESLNLVDNNIFYVRGKGDACNGKVIFHVTLGEMDENNVIMTFKKQDGNYGADVYWSKYGSSLFSVGTKISSISPHSTNKVKMIAEDIKSGKGALTGEDYSFGFKAHSVWWWGEGQRTMKVFPFGMTDVSDEEMNR